MTLDDVYGPGEDRFPLEQEAEAENWDEETLGLEWDESEDQEICREVTSQRG